MSVHTTEKLAIEGGAKAVREKLPVTEEAAGHRFGKEEMDQLAEVMESGALNYLAGNKVAEFEQAFGKMHMTKYNVASSLGTAAIHVAISSLDLEPGDEVIVPPITDMGTVIPILYQLLIPVFADVEPDICNMSPEAVRANVTPRTRAIIPVHMFGHPCDMDPIMEIAQQCNLAVIEDCCQAFLTYYKGQLCSTIGDIGCFSFQQCKHMTTGDGGMTITNNETYGPRLRLCSDKGWPRGGRFRDHLFLAPNYHMTELQAAVGIAQLRKLKGMVEAKSRTGQMLSDMIGDLAGIKPPVPRAWATYTYWKYPLRVDLDAIRVSLDEFAEALTAEGVCSWVGYTRVPLYAYDVIRKRKTFGTQGYPWTLPGARDLTYRDGLCPYAEKMLMEMLVIPWTERYTDNHVEQIAAAIHKVYIHYRK